MQKIFKRTENKYQLCEKTYNNICVYLKNSPDWKFDTHCLDRRPYHVLSQYWDTVNLDNYYASVDGTLAKGKIRFRKYPGSANNSCNIEIKTKIGHYCYKWKEKWQSDDYNLNSFKNKNSINVLQKFRKMTHQNKITFPLKAATTVSYKRLAFTHLITGTRLTIDTNITYYPPDLFFIKDSLPEKTKKFPVVLELKDCDYKNQGIRTVLEIINKQTVKFSKYVFSVEEIIF